MFLRAAMSLVLLLNATAWAGEPGFVPLNVSSAADLQAQVHALVQHGIDSSRRATQLDDAGRWGLPDALQGAAWVQLREKTLDARTRQVEAQVRLSESDTSPVTGSLRFVLRDLQQVWVTGAALRKGATLGCGNLHQEWRVTQSKVSRWSGACEELAGWRVKRPIDAGDVLLSADLAPLSAVSANEEANASVSVGSIRIEVRATALADGVVGQEIPIRLAGQSSVLKARVQGPGEVIVIKGL